MQSQQVEATAVADVKKQKKKSRIGKVMKVGLGGTPSIKAPLYLAAAPDNIQPFEAELFKAVVQYQKEMGGIPCLVSVAGGFNYIWLVGGKLNAQTLSQANKLVKVDAATMCYTYEAKQKLSELYVGILDAATYKLSSADLATVNSELAKNTAAVNLCIQTFEPTFGEITPEKITAAVPYATSKIAYIQWFVDDKFGAAYNIPEYANSFKSAYEYFLETCATSTKITDKATKANMELKAVAANTRAPSRENGGVPTTDGTDVQPAYAIAWEFTPSTEEILNRITTLSNAIEISSTCDQFTSDSCSVSVNGGGSFRTGFGCLFSVCVSASTEFDWYKYTSSATSAKFVIRYPGVTAIGASPKADESYGSPLIRYRYWWDQDVISSLLPKTGTDTTGFQLMSTTAYPLEETFGKGGRLAYFKSLLVSQTPTLHIEYSHVTVDVMSSTFKVNASTSVKLFGFINLGASMSYVVTKTSYDRTSDTFSVDMGPAVTTVPVLPQNMQGYIIAGCPDFPGSR